MYNGHICIHHITLLHNISSYTSSILLGRPAGLPTSMSGTVVIANVGTLTSTLNNLKKNRSGALIAAVDSIAGVPCLNSGKCKKNINHG